MFKKSFATSFVTLLVVIILSALIVAQPRRRNINIYSAYGGETVASSRATSRYTGPRMRAPLIRRSASLFRLAGGVMFDATGQPCKSISALPMRLSYDIKQPDGSRLRLHVGDKAYSLPDVRDEEIRPIVEFAADNRPVVVNLLEKYPGEVKKPACRRPEGFYVVTLHPAFEDTSLGWPLVRADQLPWSFLSRAQWHSKAPTPRSLWRLSDTVLRAFDTDMQDYRQGLFRAGSSTVGLTKAQQLRINRIASSLCSLDEARWSEIESEFLKDFKIERALWQGQSKKAKCSIIARVDETFNRTSNINDVNSTPLFCTAGSKVAFEHTPRVEFLSQIGNTARPLAQSTEIMSSNAAKLKDVDTEAYRAMMNVYQVGGLIRYVKKQSSLAAWTQFVRSLPRKKSNPTPRIACPTCKPGEVQSWLDCLER
jgi:hypothetical protein